MGKNVMPYVIPIVKGYQNIAFPLSVSFLNEGFVPWFYSNFIQIRCRKHFQKPFGSSDQQLRLNFYGHTYLHKYPNLDICAMNPDLYRAFSFSIIDFLMKNIDAGFYVKTNWDEFYIRDRLCFQKEHFDHDVLVYGYDAEEETVYTLGYNKNSQYETSKVSFRDFEQAHAAGGNYTICFRNKRNWSSAFDLESAVELLRQYVQSENTAKIQNNPDESTAFIYGLRVYECLSAYVEAVSNRCMRYDQRAFYSLWEHKKCMLSRLEYMSSLGYADPSCLLQYADIEQKSRLLLNMFMKAEFMESIDHLESINLINRIRKEIARLANMEEEALTRLLKQLLPISV